MTDLLRHTILLVLLFAVFSLQGQSYVNVAGQVGINHTFGEGVFGGGLSFCDFDNDGWDDITFASQAGDSLAFFKNVGGSFQRLPSLIDDIAEAKQILWADFDNDGDKDLFVSSLNAANTLYVRGNGFEFTPMILPGPDSFAVGPTYGAAFADYDMDGWLDLFICQKTVHFPIPNQLFHNNGDGTFTDVTSSMLFNNIYEATFCAGFLDINNDGRPDLYTAEDKVSVNQMYKNLGNGSFEDLTSSCGAGIVIDAMCVSGADYDNDGDLDIYVTNTPGGNKLLQNNGDESFTEIADQAGVGYYRTGWGSSFVDFDNDMDLDLYVAGSTALTPLKNAFYENVGSGQFIENASVGFENDSTRSFSTAMGDFNNDGFPDLAVLNEGLDNAMLWRNTGGGNNWIKINLEGTLSNRDGIGSWIEVWVNGAKQVRYTQCGTGYLAQNSLTEIIGLGTHTQVDSILVRWLSGLVDKLIEVPVNQTVHIIEGGSVTAINSPLSSFVSVQPNPFRQQIFIDFSSLEIQEVRYQILSESGALVQAGRVISDGLTAIEVADMSEGVYFLRLQIGNEIVVKKLLKMR